MDKKNDELQTVIDSMSEVMPALNAAVMAFANYSSSVGESLSEVLFAVAPEVLAFLEASTNLTWMRQPDEKMFEWGARLNQMGLMDDPEIRWEYQKYVLAAPWRIVRGWFLQDGE